MKKEKANKDSGLSSRISAEDFRKLRKKSKYKNVRDRSGDTIFASKGERRRYDDLRLLEQAGRIQELELQPKFELIPAFVDQDGKKIRAIFYIGDFGYIENGKKTVEDFKGVETSVFKLKEKMFKYRYRDIRFIKTRKKNG